MPVTTSRQAHDWLCPGASVLCPHSARGCKWIHARADLRQHLIICPFEAMSDFLDRHETVTAQLLAENEALKRTVADLSLSGEMIDTEDFSGSDSGSEDAADEPRQGEGGANEVEVPTGLEDPPVGHDSPIVPRAAPRSSPPREPRAVGSMRNSDDSAGARLRDALESSRSAIAEALNMDNILAGRRAGTGSAQTQEQRRTRQRAPGPVSALRRSLEEYQRRNDG